MPLTDKLSIEKKPMKTAAALRASDTQFLHYDLKGKLIDDITKPVMDEQDVINDLKAQIQAKSEAIFKIKRKANALIESARQCAVFYKEREALRKAMDETN